MGELCGTGRAEQSNAAPHSGEGFGQRSQAQPTKSAQTLAAIEHALVNATMDRARSSDPKNIDNTMRRDHALELGRNSYLTFDMQHLNKPNFSDVDVGNPAYFNQLNSELESD